MVIEDDIPKRIAHRQARQQPQDKDEEETFKKADALLGLFAPPPESVTSAINIHDDEPTPRIQKQVICVADEGLSTTTKTTPIPELPSFEPHEEKTPLLLSTKTCFDEKKNETFPSKETLPTSFSSQSLASPWPVLDVSSSCLNSVIRAICMPSTYVGAIVFLLYHVVFCLAQASAIRRPHASHESTGVLAQMAALGVIVSGPTMIYYTAPQIPAVYPASDLFLAPFLAHMAASVDQVLVDHGLENDDGAFLATFGALVSTALVLSAIWCVAAARVRLANLGNFLPYPVLTGFFTTIGILMWTLGFSVDASASVGSVLTSGDWHGTITPALWHHLPSFAIGLAMHVTNPMHPSLVIGWILVTIVGVYIVMAILGVSLEEAQESKWFFALNDLMPSSNHDDNTTATTTTSHYGIPWPGGIWVNIFVEQKVCWPAYVSGIRNVLALTVLYLIRCSLHAAALKKNIARVTRELPNQNEEKMEAGKNKMFRNVDSKDLEENMSETMLVPIQDTEHEQTAKRAKKAAVALETKQKLELGYILEHAYAYSHFMSALVGGIAVAPSVAASVTLFQLGAENAPPQYGSCLLVILIYLTGFRIVQFIPKPAFSSLMVLAGLDMCRAWLVRSYHETKSKEEWFVAPILVIFAFWWGLLNAIFLGIAISTFWFAASFYRAGVVKFVGSGLTLRSTVERGFDQVAWLDGNADLIQIMVLQNYLFFGNVQSVSNFVSTMFEEYTPPAPSKSRKKRDNEEEPMFEYIPPFPLHLILDFTFVTGMDTSACDMFREILNICRENNCRLYLVGMSAELRAMLVYAKVTPVATPVAEDSPLPNTAQQSQQSLFYFDLEGALAKAEDALMSSVFQLEQRDREVTEHLSSVSSSPEHGFLYALDQIMQQHGQSVANAVSHLKDLAPYTTLVELKAGHALPEGQGGLYFVETGLMRVQHARTGAGTLTGTWNRSTMTGSNSSNSMFPRSSRYGRFAGHHNNGDTLSGWNARSLGRQQVMMQQKYGACGQNRKTNLLDATAAVDPFIQKHPTFRLARIGHGWVTGSLPLSSEGGGGSLGALSAPIHVAVSPCRLHHLSRSVLLELEKSRPDSIMHLYKLMAYLSWKRQEMTIGQLHQFVQILQSPAPRLRKGKIDLGRIQAQAHASSSVYFS